MPRAKDGESKTGKGGEAYERARSLAESALGEYARGDGRSGDRLAEQAVQTDRRAVEDVVSDLDEDARATGAGKGAAKDRPSSD